MKRGTLALLAAHFLVLSACAHGTKVTAPDRDPRREVVPQAMCPAKEREFTFQSGDTVLRGILATPAKRCGDRAPGVVLVHGSGPQPMDEPMKGQTGMGFGFEIRVFRELSQALRASGYAVLRYDKRSCGDFNGCAKNGYPKPPNSIDIRTFLTDAGNALSSLGREPDIGPELLVIGHSQGGTFVPILMEKNPQVRAGVMLAAPYRPVDEVLSDQLTRMKTLGLATGKAADEVEKELAPLVAELGKVRNVVEHGASGATVLGAPDSVIVSMLDVQREAREAAFRVDRPLLVLSGDYDWNVPPVDTALWRDALEIRAVGHDVAVLPCITHAFNCVSNPDWKTLSPDEMGRHVSERVLAKVIDFFRIATAGNGAGAR